MTTFNDTDVYRPELAKAHAEHAESFACEASLALGGAFAEDDEGSVRQQAALLIADAIGKLSAAITILEAALEPEPDAITLDLV